MNLLNEDFSFFADDTMSYVQWITKGGRHIPIYGKDETHWTKLDRQSSDPLYVQISIVKLNSLMT